MTQYLFSVHMVEGEPVPAEDEIQKSSGRSTSSTRRSWTPGPGCSPVDCTRRQCHRRPRQDGEVLTTDGPFAETKEQLGGFWVLEAPDLDAALALAAKASAACWRPSRSGPSRTSRRPKGSGSSAGTGAIARVFRQESGRAVATLVRLFGDIDIAEEAVQEAFVVASQRWPTTGLPPNPGGWITTTARNRAIDRLRRESSRQDRHAQAALVHERDEVHEAGPVRDDRLRLIFTCCHPALATNVQVALTLRLLGGLETARSPGPSSCPRRRWRSGWCEPSARSATPTSPTGSLGTPSCRTGCGQF